MTRFELQTSCIGSELYDMRHNHCPTGELFIFLYLAMGFGSLDSYL